MIAVDPAMSIRVYRKTISVSHLIHTEGQTSAGVDSASKNVDKTGSGLFARSTSIDNRSDVGVISPTNGDRTNGVDNDNSVTANSGNTLNL